MHTVRALLNKTEECHLQACMQSSPLKSIWKIAMPYGCHWIGIHKALGMQTRPHSI